MHFIGLLAFAVLGISTIHYQFELPKDARQKLIADAQALQVGESIHVVKARLGAPQVDRHLVKKKRQVIARELRYYLRRVDPNLANLKDEYVSFLFDADNKLYEKKFHAIERPK